MDHEHAAPEAAATSTASTPDPTAAASPSPDRKKRRRRRMRFVEPIREIPPIEVCGKWVAWSGRHVVASGETLAEVKEKVELANIEDPSYELIPPANVRF